jgi:hypothetical protein
MSPELIFSVVKQKSQSGEFSHVWEGGWWGEKRWKVVVGVISAVKPAPRPLYKIHFAEEFW